MTDWSSPELDALCVKLQQWLPPAVVIASARISAADTLHPAERSFVAGAIDSRVAEFASGRSCARKALHRLGMTGSPAIPVGSWREPVWPPGFTGSITHDAGVCIAAAARKSDHPGLGIDLLDMRHMVESDVMAVVATAAEAERSNELSKDPVLAMKTLFCAKETVVKIASPQLGRFIDMTELELVWKGPEFSTRIPNLAGIIRGRVFQNGNLLLSAALQLPLHGKKARVRLPPDPA